MNVRIQSAPYVTMAVLDLGGEDDSRSFARDNGALDFGLALVALKAGHRVQRAGWNGKGMWLCILSFRDDSVFDWTPVLEAWDGQAPRDALKEPVTRPCLAMRTADGLLQPGWLASQTDMLAEDWAVLP